MKELDARAIELRVLIEENRHKRKQVYDGGQVEGSNMSYRDLLNDKFDEVKKIQSQKRSKLDRLSTLNDRIRELEGIKQNILKSIPRNY